MISRFHSRSSTIIRNLKTRVQQRSVLSSAPSIREGTTRKFASGTIANDQLFQRYQKTFSSLAVDGEESQLGPMGDLFDVKGAHPAHQDLMGMTGSVRRVFGPAANAQGLLTCGGEELARHASFDPDYTRARGWIQNRAIGPAVLSPVLISGLVGALVEAAFPQSIPVSSSMHQARPLIVGQEVLASIQVIGVQHYDRDAEEVSTKAKDLGTQQEGHEVRLLTEVVRTQDKELIAEGSHSIWIPGYLSR